MHSMQSILKEEKSTSQIYDKLFEKSDLVWKDMYNLMRRVKIVTNLRIFQYKLLHNVS